MAYLQFNWSGCDHTYIINYAKAVPAETLPT